MRKNRTSDDHLAYLSEHGTSAESHRRNVDAGFQRQFEAAFDERREKLPETNRRADHA